MKYIIPVLTVLLLSGGYIYGQTGAFWFTSSPTDTNNPVHIIWNEPGDTVTLYAWVSVDAPDWEWLGGFNFPIVFNTNYLLMDTMFMYDSTLQFFYFHGVRWPGDTFGIYPGQAMWFASLCLSDCPSAVGTYLIGGATFHIFQSVGSPEVVIDTAMYPPSNYALIGDNTGTQQIAPEWEPVVLMPVNVQERDENLSFSFHLIGPNPLSGDLNISYTIPYRTHISIRVYDTSGRLVKDLLNGVVERGNYQISWDKRGRNGRGVPAGIYFIQMKANYFSSIERVVILK